MASIRPGDRVIEPAEGSELAYDVAIVCVGAKPLPAPSGTIEMPLTGQPLAIDTILREAAQHPSHRVAFVLPPGPSWPLPLYELALMSRRRAEELGLGALECAIVTAEPAPLFLFGRIGSDSVAEVLRARGIQVLAGRRVREVESGALVMLPEEERLEVGCTIALPTLEGPRIPGLPADARGFIPIDEHARVVGAEDLYAAGDGANFPVKQGGIGTQQADAAAEHIAARFGADVEPRAFRPVLRGKLLTGEGSLHMRAEPTGGGGEGMTSADCLWWPPHKVSGRYLSAWLAGEPPSDELAPPAHPLDVEVSLPHEWHSEPMA
jgi:sulfide:quinone oxidoreductase